MSRHTARTYLGIVHHHFEHPQQSCPAAVQARKTQKQMFVLVYSLLAWFKPQQFKPILLGPPAPPPPTLYLGSTAHHPLGPPPHLGSANLSMQLLELAKPSLPTLGQPPPSRFCHELAKLSLSLPKHPLVFANSSAQVLELAKSSLLCLLNCPPPLFLPIRACKCLNWQNRAHSHAYPCPHPLPFVLWIPALVCSNSQKCEPRF